MIAYERTGRTVTLTFGATNGGVSGGFIGSNWFDFDEGEIPLSLRPMITETFTIVIEGNGNWSAGNCRISATGKIDIFNGFSTGGWNAGYTAGFRAFSVTYLTTSF